MPHRTSTQLKELEKRISEFGGTASAHKLRILQALEPVRLNRPSETRRFHEALCFLRAYPDDSKILAAVERILSGFDRRADLRRHRKALADTGIAGTSIHYRFYFPTAIWLARRWRDRLRIHWEGFDTGEWFERLLPLLVHYSETPGLDESAFEPREWLRRLHGPDESDAVFLIRRIRSLPLPYRLRETLYDHLYLPIHLAPGPGTPSRSRAKQSGCPVVWQKRSLVRSRPVLRQEIRRPPRAVRPVTRAEGRKLIDLAREAMITRERDLDVFAHGDPDDVRLVDDGNGLRFACIGMVPDRRLLLEAVYGFLTLKNGVPIGYVLCSALFASSEIAYNVFEPYRGGEAAFIYGRILAMIRHLFRADTFTVYPYQMGEGNPEALRSGAWWFYQKLGFRAREAEILRLMREERRRMRADPSLRSNIATLKRLASANVYLHLGRPREDVIGQISLSRVGLRVTRYLSDRFGSDRRQAIRTCSREAASRLGLAARSGWSAGERLAWERWSPLLMIIPGIEQWSRGERRDLARVVRAKGGKRESEFVARFDRHRRLRRAIRKLAEDSAD